MKDSQTYYMYMYNIWILSLVNILEDFQTYYFEYSTQ